MESTFIILFSIASLVALAVRRTSIPYTVGLVVVGLVAGELQFVSPPQLTSGTIRVDGYSATADVRSSAKGEKPSRDTLQLVRVGGSWRIASLK